MAAVFWDSVSIKSGMFGGTSDMSPCLVARKLRRDSWVMAGRFAIAAKLGAG
jgi:hypothetical protein